MENYVARVGAAESAQAVEQCGFPGTVWSYQAQNCSGIHIEAYAVERNDTLELNANVVDFQNLGLQRRALYFRNREWTKCRSGLGVARSVWGWRQRLDGASLGVKTARACSADTCFNTSADDYFALEP